MALGSEAEPTHIAVEMLGVDAWQMHNAATTGAAHQEAHRAIDRTIQAALDRHLSWLTLVSPVSQLRRREQQTWFSEQTIQQALSTETAQSTRLWFSVNDENPRQTETEAAPPKQPPLDVLCALHHDGRQQVLNTVRALARDVQFGQISVSDVTADAVHDRINPTGLPDPDLVIRPACPDPVGDGCLLWQSTYSELLFLSKCWPDFSKDDLHAAIDHYKRRERRFGGIQS